MDSLCSRFGIAQSKTDIFTKDVILIPINHAQAHWTCAVLNMRLKRIEAYDSLGMGDAPNIFLVRSLLPFRLCPGYARVEADGMREE